MAATYAYSLFGTGYTGRFESREAAVTAAVQAIRKLDEPPGTVYVGKRVPADPHVRGLAELVLEYIRRGVREDNGDAADGYLRDLTPQQVRELDNLLGVSVLDWMHRHELLPPFHRIQEISEHTVPTPHAVPAPPHPDKVVEDIGESPTPPDMPGDWG